MIACVEMWSEISRLLLKDHEEIGHSLQLLLRQQPLTGNLEVVQLWVSAGA